MDRICLSAEKHRNQIYHVNAKTQLKYVDEAIAMATMYTANHLDIKAIIALTDLAPHHY